MRNIFTVISTYLCLILLIIIINSLFIFGFFFILPKDFSDSEFKKWLEDCSSHGASPPTLDDIEKKLSDIKEATNYEFKEEDIDKVNLNAVNFFIFKFVT